jgi:hypothetical protein
MNGRERETISSTNFAIQRAAPNYPQKFLDQYSNLIKLPCQKTLKNAVIPVGRTTGISKEMPRRSGASRLTKGPGRHTIPAGAIFGYYRSQFGELSGKCRMALTSAAGHLQTFCGVATYVRYGSQDETALAVV